MFETAFASKASGESVAKDTKIESTAQRQVAGKKSHTLSVQIRSRGRNLILVT